jgi:type IV secretory pathway VirB3-like protein
MKSPIGTHTPQKMLLAAGVSLTKVVFILVSPRSIFLLLKFVMFLCVCVCFFYELDKIAFFFFVSWSVHLHIFQ